MRNNLTYAQRMALAEWLKALSPEEVWDVKLRQTAERATQELGCAVTQHHIEYARKALALPKPEPEPTLLDRIDGHEVRLLTLEAQVEALARGLAAGMCKTVVMPAAPPAGRPYREPDPELTRVGTGCDTEF